MERTPNEHLLQALFHVQCALSHIDKVHSQTIPSEFTLSLQKKLRNFDNYATRQMKIMAKLYAIDQEAMLIFEDAFNAKVDEVVGMSIADFVKVEE
jgi:phosphatidylglycerophosphatase A